MLAELEQRTPKWLRVCYGSESLLAELLLRMVCPAMTEVVVRPEKDEIRGTDITNANLKNNLRLNVTRCLQLGFGVMVQGVWDSLDGLSFACTRS